MRQPISSCHFETQVNKKKDGFGHEMKIGNQFHTDELRYSQRIMEL